MDISDLLEFSVKNKTPDLHLSAGLPPMIRVHGDIRNINVPAFDQALFDLYEADVITYEDTLRNADSENDIRLKIKLEGKATHDKDLPAGLDSLGIV
ncbi:MAG: hypothetical protein EXR38_01590 [Methylotenera sp.]|nr:hypothetical protein [Methylotenera sp.]MSP99196.1 hypothetical protein [Methylotenera sp.]